MMNSCIQSLKELRRVCLELEKTFVGLQDELLSLCADKRIVHLAKYARKVKVRKKNFNRGTEFWRKLHHD